MNARQLARQETAKRIDSELNEAEIIQRIERNQQRPMRRLNKDKFPLKRITVRSEPEVELTVYGNLCRGDTVMVREDNPIDTSWRFGMVQGITPDGRFVRLTSGRLYPINSVERYA